MDTLWRDHTFSEFDVNTFVYDERSDAGSTCIYTDSGNEESAWLQTETAQDADTWVAWFKRIGFQDGANGLPAATAVILCPRAVPRSSRQVKDQPGILSWLPFSRGTFMRIIGGMRLHRALSVLLDSGAPTISRIPCCFKGQRGYVYILRVEHTMSHHTALTITHIPGDAKGTGRIYAMMLGCSRDDIINVSEKLGSSRASASSPFTLIKAFLERERKYRFSEVDAKITHFQNTVQSYGHRTLEASLDISKGGNAQDPQNLIGLYLEVCHLKNGLAAWKAQIENFRQYVGDFPAETDIDPDEYLQRLAALYNIRFNKCDLVLQGTSLTFQMETAHLSRFDAQLARLDTATSLRDGKQMKAIALLTMVFLPATFVATLMAVPVFKWDTVTSIPQWSIYLVFFIPLTVITLAAYAAWTNYFKPKALQRLDKAYFSSSKSR